MVEDPPLVVDRAAPPRSALLHGWPLLSFLFFFVENCPFTYYLPFSLQKDILCRCCRVGWVGRSRFVVVVPWREQLEDRDEEKKTLKKYYKLVY